MILFFWHPYVYRFVSSKKRGFFFVSPQMNFPTRLPALDINQTEYI